MRKFVAKRIRFQNGERLSVLQVVNGLPVHEVTLYLGTFRTKGRASNTIHTGPCRSLALLYNHLESVGIDLLGRLQKGQFLTIPELERIAALAQYRFDNLDDVECETSSSNVVSIHKIALRRKRQVPAVKSVAVGTQASRIRYIGNYLEFLAKYIATELDDDSKKIQLEGEMSRALASFREHIPAVPNRATLDARIGLSEEEQERVLAIVHPDSSQNPWKRRYVRVRNWLIIVLLLASGMRRGELLGLQIGDIHQNEPKIRIIRRADAEEDSRLNQPGTKTNDREIELRTSIMKVLWSYINKERRSIRAARSIPQVFVSDEGEAFSAASVDKLFAQLRQACPGLPMQLTSHVLRHTWNERFSEQAELMGLTDTIEERARNTQQGWSDNSNMAATYTRRRIAAKGRAVSLKLQEKLDEQLSYDEQ